MKYTEKQQFIVRLPAEAGRRRLFLPSELYPFDSLSELPRGVSEFKMLMADTDNNNRHSPLLR